MKKLFIAVILVIAISSMSFASIFSQNFSVNITQGRINNLVGQYVIPHEQFLNYDGIQLKVTGYNVSLNNNQANATVTAVVGGETVVYNQIQSVYYLNGGLNFVTTAITVSQNQPNKVTDALLSQLNSALNDAMANGQLNYVLPVKSELNLTLFHKTVGSVKMTSLSLMNGAVHLQGTASLF